MQRRGESGKAAHHVEEFQVTEEEQEGFWRRRWTRVKRRRARKHLQIDAAQASMEACYAQGREKLLDAKKITPEDARKFSRIDERLFYLQQHPRQLEIYDWKKQFHDEWIEKYFAQKPSKNPPIKEPRTRSYSDWVKASFKDKRAEGELTRAVRDDVR